MAFVLDCSVTMAWVFPDEACESTEALLESLLVDSAVVPALWPVEVTNVLLVATRRGRITEAEWPQIRDNLEALPIDVDEQSRGNVLQSILPIASAYRLSAYDAMYLELALRLNIPLATLDRKLANSAKQAGVEVLCA